jgi:hypothetical protein
MIPAVNDNNIKEACRLTLQQRGKARNSQIRATVDAHLLAEASTASKHSVSALKGQNISLDDTESFLDWAISIVEENVGDGTKNESYYDI